jgi:hypothetical protein
VTDVRRIELILVDAHVHVYPVFNFAALLSSAYDNFARHARVRQHAEVPWQGVVMLSETSACDWFARSYAAGDMQLENGWRVVASESESESLWAVGPAQQKLCIVAGRQVNTREGIEVLTLGTRTHVPDGMTLEETLRDAEAADAVVVLPWGVGKWLGSRGALVRKALETRERQVFAGDNSGRPWIWPRPAIFESSVKRGVPVLPGTDPLPLAGEEKRVGSFGFAMEGSLPNDRPAIYLRDRLRGPALQTLRPFGRSESVGAFFYNQIKLRLAKAA